MPLITAKTSGQPENQERNVLSLVNPPNHTRSNLLVKALASSLAFNLSTKNIMDHNSLVMSHIDNSFLSSQLRNSSPGEGGKRDRIKGRGEE